MAKKVPLTWTQKQREVVELAEQGKTFQEITDSGYSLNMTSRVLNALKEGQKPELEVEESGSGSDKPLVAVTGPKSAPIMYRIDQKQIALDPLELNRQYGYYLDLTKKDGETVYSFSQVLTLAMQTLWALHQEIPWTENMLRALFYGYK